MLRLRRAAWQRPLLCFAIDGMTGSLPVMGSRPDTYSTSDRLCAVYRAAAGFTSVTFACHCCFVLLSGSPQFRCFYYITGCMALLRDKNGAAIAGQPALRCANACQRDDNIRCPRNRYGGWYAVGGFALCVQPFGQLVLLDEQPFADAERTGNPCGASGYRPRWLMPKQDRKLKCAICDLIHFRKPPLCRRSIVP